MGIEEKNSDVGMSWEMKKLVEVCDIKNGRDHKKVNNPNGLYPIIGSGGIMGYANDYLCEGNATIIGRKGSINNPIFIESKFWNVDTAFALCTKNNLDSKFFYYFCTTYNFEKHNKATTLPSLTKTDLLEILIPIPPLPIQKRIAEILDAADALKRKDQELLKKYDELAQAIFIDMFGANKEIVKLNHITKKITDGVHAKPNYQASGVPFLSVKNATNRFLDFNNSKFISQADHEVYSKRCKPEFEDILYTKVGATYGRAAIVDSKTEFSIYVSLALIKPDRSKVYPYYLNFVLNTNYVKNQADRRVKGAGVPDLHLVEIKDFDIPLPTYDEQLEFSNVIENLNKNIKVLKNQIVKSESLFQTLLQKAFKGELT